MTATSTQSLVMSALFARAALLASTGPSLPVDFPEHKGGFTVPTDNKYLRVTFFTNIPRWEGVSDGVMNQGLLQISVVWPKNLGLIAPGNVVGQIISHFAKGTVLMSGSVKVKIVKEPWFSSPIPEDSNVAIPVSIPWVA